MEKVDKEADVVDGHIVNVLHYVLLYLRCFLHLLMEQLFLVVFFQHLDELDHCAGCLFGQQRQRLLLQAIVEAVREEIALVGVD